MTASEKHIELKDSFIKNILLLFLYTICISNIIGHFIENEFLTSFGQNKVSMKFSTGYVALLTTIIITKSKYSKEIALTISTILSTIISITSFYVFTSWYFNNAKPVMFPLFESAGSVLSLKGDVPSWGTMSFFFLFGVQRIFKIKWLAYMGMIQSIIALFGHFLKVPFMYYYFEGYSTGEAINTALVILSVSIYELISFKKIDYETS